MTLFLLLVQGVQALMRSAVHPLLQSVTDSIEAIIITLHQEDFSGSVVSLPASLHQQQLSTYVRVFLCLQQESDSFLLIVAGRP